MILGVMCTMFLKVVSFVAVLLSDLFFSIFEGLNLSFDQVLVQGMRDSNRSVSLYYLKTSTDNNTFIEVQEQGARKVTRKQNNSKKLYTAWIFAPCALRHPESSSPIPFFQSATPGSCEFSTA